MSKPTVATVKQKIDDHVDACSERYEAIDKRLWRMEMVMIGASVSTITLLLRLVLSVWIGSLI